MDDVDVDDLRMSIRVVNDVRHGPALGSLVRSRCRLDGIEEGDRDEPAVERIPEISLEAWQTGQDRQKAGRNRRNDIAWILPGLLV